MSKIRRMFLLDKNIIPRKYLKMKFCSKVLFLKVFYSRKRNSMLNTDWYIKLIDLNLSAYGQIDRLQIAQINAWDEN